MLLHESNKSKQWTFYTVILRLELAYSKAYIS